MGMSATTVPTESIRERVAAARERINRVKRLDRAATVLITGGGILVIVAVLFIFVFILNEAIPLFRSAEGEFRGTLSLVVPEAAPGGAPPKPLVFGVDEYQLYVYQLLDDGRFVFSRGKDGSVAQQVSLGLPTGTRLTAASRTLLDDYVAAARSDGQVSLHQVRFTPRYEDQKLVDLDVEVRARGTFVVDPEGRAIQEVAFEEREDRRSVASVVSGRPDEIVVLSVGADDAPARQVLRTQDSEPVTHVRFGRSDTLIASTEQGQLYHWELLPETRLTERTAVSREPITALEYTLGGVSLIVGDAKGNVSAWFRVRENDDDPEPRFVKAHGYEPHSAAIRAIGASPRDKSFATVGDGGSVVLRHMTSERTVLRFPGEVPLDSVLITPKVDAILARREEGGLVQFAINSPHPEISWRALFGKVWYEGYPGPEYTWQSTGGTDDFEPKFSLIPLIFGTIKGTVYALLFAIPLAILGALYTSQFMHPSLKAKVKPTVEVMAALPSVVVGFIAGLWLASRVEREVVPVLLMTLLLPLFGTAGFLLWNLLPTRLSRRLRPGTELAVILPLLLLGGWLALSVGPWAEGALFGGDFRIWLQQAMDLVYDQRNCLVVGLAMGFAVIPIIFTISEDAFSSVPSHLTAASLALGANRWQTASRVVLPTASPGIFSAVMIGFGRAVGETMIVLMATGNTPVLDWSIFNGMRTLSANIAVEIPEAPHGGTLYRTLFLAGLALFILTFIVNTVAELVRQRLRERYKAI
jgi:phosphate transport system permease protein